MDGFWIPREPTLDRMETKAMRGVYCKEISEVRDVWHSVYVRLRRWKVALADNWKQCLRDMPPNWDGYGAAKISEYAIATLGRFAVVPLADGGIQLEVHKDGYHVEIEILPTGEINSVLVSHSSTPRCALAGVVIHASE